MSDLPIWLADAVTALQRGDTAGWMTIYRDDAVHEFPFAPEGQTHRLEGRDAIAAYMTKLKDMMVYGSVDDVRVDRSSDSLVVEGLGHHHRADDGKPVDVRFIWHMQLDGDKVALFRDYMDSGQLAKFQ